MPNKLFQTTIAKTIEPSEQLSLNPLLIYRVPGLYFVENTAISEINLQLQMFRESTIFPDFENQYGHLLDSLNQWAEQHSVFVLVEIENEHSVPAFCLLKKRLFDESNFYSTRKAELLCGGKKALEEIFLLLQQEA